MEVMLSFVIGGLYAAGLYLMMRRNIVKLIMGLTLIGHAANLLIFTMGRLTRGAPPIVGPDQVQLLEPYADPVPQALILTAIVIGFGLQAFTVVLIRRSYETVGTGDLDRMRSTDSIE
jgi:multicomponent Na+:H+ antiporter subunit C